jgi:shikimate dehydrogenase
MSTSPTDGGTKKVALIGQPLRRRHSAVMHNAAFVHYGIDAQYELRETATADLAEFFEAVRRPVWLGFQVTAPHKQAVMEYVDSVDKTAASIGAVNSGLRRADGSLEGFNTDAAGFSAALTADLGVAIHGQRFVVAGAGGASRAVVWALLTGGASQVVVGNRHAESAQALAARFSDLGMVVGVDLAGDEFGDALSESDVAVNATTVGMTSDSVPFDVGRLSDQAAVFDLVYVPSQTPLVAAARQRGLPVRNGIDMLVRQAEVAFKRWTGVDMAADVMREALDAWMAGATKPDERL